jgi:hypothetical protein
MAWCLVKEAQGQLYLLPFYLSINLRDKVHVPILYLQIEIQSVNLFEVFDFSQHKYMIRSSHVTSGEDCNAVFSVGKFRDKSSHCESLLFVLEITSVCRRSPLLCWLPESRTPSCLSVSQVRLSYVICNVLIACHHVYVHIVILPFYV